MADLDLFISHAGKDRPWAEWVAWQLVQAGYRVELDSWDWAPGENFVERMRDAMQKASRVVALWSEAYFESHRFTTPEWTAAFTNRDGSSPTLVPVRIEHVTPPQLLRPILCADIFGLDSATARRVLIEAVGGVRRPVKEPPFPERAAAGNHGPPIPGTLPSVWNVPVRITVFVGRDDTLLALRERLASGNSVVVHALHGVGGVGKTQLAVEYAHRFSGDYEAIWWIDAEQPGLIGEQMTALGLELGVAEPSMDPGAAAARVKHYLRSHSDWLLVFDNARAPAELVGWLPTGPGHVLITSRSPGWGQVATTLEVDVFTRHESMSLLRRLAPALPDLEIGEISHQLGDLPLGIAQAASVLAETGMSGEEYLRELNLHAADLLDEGVPVPYSRSLAAVVRVSMNRLGQEEEAAVQLMQICAMLAPEPVPLELFTTAPKGILPEPLAAAGTSNLAMRRLVGRLARYGLARVSGEGPHLHRLTQAIVVDTLTPHERLDVHSHARRLLSAMNPADSTNPALWPRWSRLLSHWLAVNSINIGGADLQSLASEAALQLLTQGESPAAQRLAAMLYQVWRIQLGGDDHPDVLCVARSLAHAYRALGRYVQAQTWDEDTLARSRRVLGNDHPDTLASAAALATDLRALRRYEQARALDEETLARSRRTIGLDQPDSIAAACNVAADYRELGRFDEAYSLDNRTLAQSRSALGDHHPHTLTLVANLATDALHIERPLIALELYQEALNGMRQTLGLSHPDTLNTADALALCMDRLGNVEEARDLDHETLRALQRPADDKRPLPAAIGEVAINLYRLGLVRQAAPLNRSTIGRDQQINGQHKETLMSASYLAVELHRLRRIDDMRQLEVEVLRRCVGWRE